MQIIAIKTYENSDTEKTNVLKDNLGRTGIYRWTNLSTGKGETYVGSALDLTRRLKSYYNISYLEREIKKNKSLIYRAILNHGYSSFKLEILEYCDKDIILKREQFYLDFLNPSITY